MGSLNQVDQRFGSHSAGWALKWNDIVCPGMEVEIEGAARPGMVTKDGLMICGTDGKYLCITINLSFRLYAIIEISIMEPSASASASVST